MGRLLVSELINGPCFKETPSNFDLKIRDDDQKHFDSERTHCASRAKKTDLQLGCLIILYI